MTPMNNTTTEHKRFSPIKPFTTEKKVKRLVWHKQSTVRTRATALQESFYPTVEVTYNAAKMRMATLLGIVDRATVLAYLGRPAYTKRDSYDHSVQYLKSGTVVNKHHTTRRKVLAKKGYIEVFGLGYCYVVESGEWLIHWLHCEQLSLDVPTQRQSDGLEQNVSKENISLSNNGVAHCTCAMESEHTEIVVGDREEREFYICERNCESESNRGSS